MQKTDLNVFPFYDDYDESKKFQRILFRPQPIKVQTRELNQMQSILQNQIERFGNHIFKEGSVVVSGGLTVVNNQMSLTFELAGGTEPNDLLHIQELYFESADKTARARVMHLEMVDGIPNQMFCIAELVVTGDIDFKVDDALYFAAYDEKGNMNRVGFGVIKGVGQSLIARLLAGVYYIRGMFIYVEPQTYIVNKYANNTNHKVGFLVSENIITEEEDPSLFSQAQGTPNYKAPGAHRLQIELKLAAFDYDQQVDNFIELAKIFRGNIQSAITQSQYSLLDDTLAQRTFEQSGNYNVEPHQIDIREHLMVDGNGGVFTEEEGGDPSKFVAVLKPGISYVMGRRVQNVGEEYVVIEKSRETEKVTNTPVAMATGNYLTTKNSKGVPSISRSVRYRLLNASGVQIGSALCISAEKVNGEFKLYMRDITWTGDRSTFAKVSFEESGVTRFISELESNQFSMSSANSLIFELPVSGVKTLSKDGVTNMNYTIMQSFKVSLNGQGQGSVASGLGVSFSPEFALYSVAKSDGSAHQIDAQNNLSLTGVPVGSALQINLGTGFANQEVVILALMIKTSSSSKNKTLSKAMETKTFTNTDKVTLGFHDGQKLLTVLDDKGVDVTSNFKLDGGQREDGYYLSTLTSLTGVIQDMTLSVTYNYYAHSSGDYFTVDSYSSVAYDQIPTFQAANGSTYWLSDCIDFRPRITNGASDTDVVRPNSALMMNGEYYLPRIDAIYVSDGGVFGAAKGVSANNLQIPSVPDNAMHLYNLVIPPYTPNIDEIEIKTIDNRRYTMRDIGKLEKRIENVEYYTTLSALENSAMTQQVFDPVTGIPRFKNGIAADPFKDFRLVDDKSADWMGSIEFGKGLLRPFVQQNAIDMKTTYPLQDGMVVCRYKSKPTVIQDYATTTINVNPYAVFNWEGFIKMDPSTDYWFENYYVEPRIINETVNTRGAVQEGSIYGTWRTTDTNTYRQGNWQYTTTTQVRDVTTYTYTDETTTVMTGEQIVETQVIPYMREIPIKFVAEGLRPFTKMYAFFTGRKIGQYCKQDGKNLGEQLVTDANGRITGIFYVPQNSDMKFSTGDNVFRLSDSPDNSQSEDETQTSAEVVHKSFGKRQGIQKTYVNTRVLGYSTSKSTESQSSTEGHKWRDPIAQSFMVSSGQVGEFIESVDVFFSTKAREIPITLEIREMSNGLPAHNVVTRKTLNPSQVNVSKDSSVATRFKFDYPVFLQTGVEFAIVLLANTQDYNAFIAKMGEKNLLTNEFIGKQPYTGVFFMSSNGSTWTPDQTADMKFRLNSAEFEAGANVVEFTPDVGPKERPLSVNAMACKKGVSEVTVYCPGHGLVSGNDVTFSKASGGCGFTENEINRKHTVKDAKYSSFVIVMPRPADSDGNIGGEKARFLGNYLISMFYTDITSTVIQGSEMTLEYSYRDAATNAISNWAQFESGKDVHLPTEGIYREPGDFRIRATMYRSEANNFVAPMIDTQDFTVVLNSFGVDPFEKVFRYVTKDVAFNDPCSSVKIYVGAKLPSQSSLELQVKLIRTGESYDDVNWETISPTQPLLNDNSNFFEYEFAKNVNAKNPFIGLKVRIMVSGSRVFVPALKDFRLIALA